MGRTDEDSLVTDMIELARQYGRYGYRRIAALLRDAGWHVNDKRGKFPLRNVSSMSGAANGFIALSSTITVERL